MRPLVTLTTDFGEGAYVAQVKGVILSLAPDVRIVDVTHFVSPGDTREAAYLMETVIPAFPEGSIHVAVVDPGVGTDRRALALRFAGRTLVGPDNGVFTAFLAHADEVRELAEPALFLPDVSPTFHGRDVFAPVAAHLANGVELQAVGPLLGDAPVAITDLYAEGSEGVVLHVDRFGNVITSFPASALAERPTAWLSGPGGEVRERSLTFGLGPEDEPFLFGGSGGRLEVGVSGGRASDRLAWDRGTPLSLVEE